MLLTKDLLLAIVAPGLVAAGLVALICVWFERKIAALVQHRYGPYRICKRLEGVLQPIADFIKLILSEPIIPREVNKFLYVSLPIILDTLAILPVAFMPIAPKLIMVDVSYSIFIVLAILPSTSLVIALIGWAASDKFTYIGTAREVLQALSYEIVLILTVLSMIILYNTGSIYKMVLEQKYIPGAVLNPLAFILFIICALMATSRFPFEIPEAETEIVFGPFTEYSGSLFALAMFGVYLELYTYALLGTCMFLSGWWGPFASYVPCAVAWTYIKTMILCCFMVFLRAAYPRLRIDQVLKLSTKWLVLLGFAACGLSLAIRLLLLHV